MQGTNVRQIDEDLSYCVNYDRKETNYVDCEMLNRPCKT